MSAIRLAHRFGSAAGIHPAAISGLGFYPPLCQPMYSPLTQTVVL